VFVVSGARSIKRLRVMSSYNGIRAFCRRYLPSIIFPQPLSGAALPQSHSLALPAPKRRTNGRIWRIASRIPIQSFAPDLTAFPSFENGFLPKRGQPDPSPYGQSCARTGDRQFAGSALASMGVVTTGMFYVAVLPFSFSALPSIGSSLTNSPPRQKPRFAARAPRLRPPR